jgi:hypothetical protein
VHAPRLYLKHPAFLAVTVMGRSEPPEIVPEGSKGDEAAKSTIKPVFLPAPCHVTVVPDLMQIGESFGKPGMLGVTDASLPPPVRLTSRRHGELLDPHVLAAEQSCSGCGFEQNELLPFLSLATMWPAIRKNPIKIQLHTTTGKGLFFTRHLHSIWILVQLRTDPLNRRCILEHLDKPR